MTLHEQLEERLADFVGKRKAVVHTTGYLTNYGVINALVTPQDVIVGDRENRGSVVDGCRVTNAAFTAYDHNDPADAERRIDKAAARYPEANLFLMTQGIFGLTGDVATALPRLAELKQGRPRLILYLDDSYGLGAMGEKGRGTANALKVTSDVDYIMGTFSKSLASIGGFVAADDLEIMSYIRHHSKSLIFSAALPAMNAAAVLACLDIIEREPERRERLWAIVRRVRARLGEMGLVTGQGESPVIPIFIGDEDTADAVVQDLFAGGVYSQVVKAPAVPRGKALLRTTFMSTFEDRHVDHVLSLLDQLADKYGLRARDLNVTDPFLTVPSSPESAATPACPSL